MHPFTPSVPKSIFTQADSHQRLKRSLPELKESCSSIWHEYCCSKLPQAESPGTHFHCDQMHENIELSECLQSEGEFCIFQEVRRETNSSLDAYEEFKGRGKKQKISSLDGGFLLFFLLCIRSFV